MTRRAILLENGLAAQRESARQEEARAEETTEVPCVGCGHMRKGRGLFCRGCRWNGRIDPEEEAA